MSKRHLWVTVLAGGDGQRVRSLSKDALGRPVPKQFCSFGEPEPMVKWALKRAAALVPSEQIVAVVAEDHRAYWEAALERLDADNILAQPENRGTAAGILLATLHIAARYPDAHILFLPSDHFVADEAVFLRALIRAAAGLRRRDDRIHLVGVPASNGDHEYGWVVPTKARRAGAIEDVERFVEKPDQSVARDLRNRGALVNTFAFAAKASALVQVFDEGLPHLLEAFKTHLSETRWPAPIRDFYSQLPRLDFSSALLEVFVERLAVVRSRECGWTDLGTPARLVRFYEERRSRAPKRRGGCLANTRRPASAMPPH